MSLYYGHSSQRNGVRIPRSNDFFITFTFPALSLTNWVIPTDVKAGYPTPVPYIGKYVTKDTSITLMEHTFDKDGVITDLKVEYSIYIFKKDGTQSHYSLGEFDVSANMLPLATRYVSIVDKTYKLSDLHQKNNEIAIIYVRVKKLSGTTAGNESAMTVRISY